MDRSSPPSQPEWDTLVGEGNWLRRLAVALVGKDRAEDLAQDVMVQALGQQPPGEPRALRAWLRTVARRMASRGRSQEKSRNFAEGAGARPEGIEDLTQQRLELHGRLNKAILDLPAPYRTALALRYLEDLPTAEIAQRLSLSEVATRQRISRGLAQLRKDLDGEFSSRPHWHGALLFLVGDLPAPTLPLVPVAASAALGVGMGLIVMKKIVAVAVVLVALVVGVVWSAKSGLVESEAPREELDGVEPLAEVEEDSGAVEISDLAETQLTREAMPEKQSVPVANEPRLLVVSAEGDHCVGALVARVSLDGQVEKVELDDKASLPIGGEPVGTVFVARAEGLASMGIAVTENSGGLILILPRYVPLAGRVFVDGVPAQAGIDIGQRWTHRQLLINQDLHKPWDVVAGLEELQVLEVDSWTQTLPGGSFAFEQAHPASLGSIQTPASYRMTERTPPQTRYPAPGKEYVIYLTRLPYLTGRFVLDDSDDPFVGSAVLVEHARLEGYTSHSTFVVPPSGRFDVALNYLDPDKPENGLQNDWVEFVLVTPGGPPQKFRFDVALGSVPRDVGVVRVKGPARMKVLVRNVLGEPVEQALLYGSGGTVRTNSEGRAPIVIPDGESVLLVALGYEIQRLSSVDLPPEMDGEIAITMQKGSALRVTAEWPGGRDGVWSEERLRFSFAPEYIQQFEVNGGQPVNGILGTFVGSVGRTTFLPGGGMSVELGSRDGIFRIPGLLPGSVTEVSLLDPFSEILAQENVVGPSSPEVISLHLVPDPETTGSLEFAWVGPDGSSLNSASARIGSSKRHFYPFAITQKEPKLGTMKVGRYQVTATAPGFVEKKFEFDLQPGENYQRIEMERGRELSIGFLDAAGQGVQPGIHMLELASGKIISSSLKWKDGRLRATAVPFEPGTLVVRFGVRNLRLPILAGDTERIFEAPKVGSLLVHMAVLPNQK